MSCGIYIFVNKTNGKIYVGQSTNIEERYSRHFRADNTRNKPYFHKALDKYGKDGFIFEIIELCDKEFLSEREKYWIAFYDSSNREKGYNSTDGGEGEKSRSIKQYTSKGELIKTYNSITDAALETQLPASNICNVLKGKRKSCGGYQWRYAEDNAPGEYIWNQQEHLKKLHKLNSKTF